MGSGLIGRVLWHNSGRAAGSAPAWLHAQELQHHVQMHQGPSDPPASLAGAFTSVLGATLTFIYLYVSSLAQMSTRPLLTGSLAFSTDLAVISKHSQHGQNSRTGIIKTHGW